MKDSSKNKNKNEKTKKPNFNSEKKKKEIEQLAKKQEKKDEQYKKLEAYISESGLTLAFNIIFAELISKQILPENFFTYTAMRLKQIGKEIEGMNTKVPIYVDKTKTDENGENQNKGEGDENKNDEDNVFMTAQKNK
jgi:hypothetical protein